MKPSFSLFSAGVILAGALALPAQASDRILNASYDIARELFQAINPAFIEDHAAATGQNITVRQSHAGSSSQARSILQGLAADVVTFNQITDIQVLVDGGLVAPDWQARLPNQASPFYSLPAFLVRAGNPKNIRDWEDLAGDGVSLVFPNPKTSGNGRYTYLAAWGDAHLRFEGDEDKVRAFIQRFIGNVRVFDTGGRGATTTFAERGIGDVLITFESEVNHIRREHGEDRFEVVIPSRSLLAEFPVAVVDRVVDRQNSRALAESYLQYLYTPRAQEILAGFHYRVTDESVRAAHNAAFPAVELFTAEDLFGSWAQAQQRHFSDGGTLDQAQAASRRR
ncbi:sulfate transport system substrate-binding protein [Ectothiorhodospira magna]|uniref:Sulfate transport system substrate-binding protein n=1 Tax=Ectothiorhodospira magna TaxID=867345 RepID=A0A1H9BAF0_9GAMM|nr:thiosulfate ABC transporter substrate-binding protein CysP [Ectothiorhodospira magna]SEP85944.1 sulfate transport system substrate-binding protein [Ectothiorhodospira magna]